MSILYFAVQHRLSLMKTDDVTCEHYDGYSIIVLINISFNMSHFTYSTSTYISARPPQHKSTSLQGVSHTPLAILEVTFKPLQVQDYLPNYLYQNISPGGG